MKLIKAMPPVSDRKLATLTAATATSNNSVARKTILTESCLGANGSRIPRRCGDQRFPPAGEPRQFPIVRAPD
jgi:hypothetical protein